MQQAALLSVVLPLASALVLPFETPECSTFARSLDLDTYNATLLNATYYPFNSLNVSNTFNNVSFCEIYTSVSYGSGNNTLIAATWLPDRLQYNDRFIAVGNGGMAGTIDFSSMLTQLNSGLGFAVAGGDAGHRASDNNGGSGETGVNLPYLHDKEQITAWIHDAISLFTPTAKALTAAYYGKDASHSFYSGCSTGGAQGMALAQYHPDLFDGIVAGCPGNWYSHLALSFLWNAQHTAVRDLPTRHPCQYLTDIRARTTQANLPKLSSTSSQPPSSTLAIPTTAYPTVSSKTLSHAPSTSPPLPATPQQPPILQPASPPPSSPLPNPSTPGP